jgi:hypothetical protein
MIHLAVINARSISMMRGIIVIVAIKCDAIARSYGKTDAPTKEQSNKEKWK